MIESKAKPGISPLIMGVSVSAGLLLALFISEYLLGRFAHLFQPTGFRELSDLRKAVFHCLLAGYVPAAYLYALRSARSVIQELELTLTLRGGQEAVIHHRVTKKEFIAYGLLGVSLVVLTPYLSAQYPWIPSMWTPEIAWHRILGLVIGWWSGCFFYVAVKESVRISHTAALIRSIDLLNLREFAPFVRQGLVNVLLAVGLMAIFSLFLLESGMGTTFAVLLGVTMPTAVLGLLLPVLGVHRRIHEAKQSELAWALERMREARLRLKGQSSDPVRGEMADLTTYYHLIEQTPEWPFRTSTFVRVILFLLIPIGSWSGGSIVDAWLGRMFG